MSNKKSYLKTQNKACYWSRSKCESCHYADGGCSDNPATCNNYAEIPSCIMNGARYSTNPTGEVGIK